METNCIFEIRLLKIISSVTLIHCMIKCCYSSIAKDHAMRDNYILIKICPLVICQCFQISIQELLYLALHKCGTLLKLVNKRSFPTGADGGKNWRRRESLCVRFLWSSLNASVWWSLFLILNLLGEEGLLLSESQVCNWRIRIPGALIHNVLSGEDKQMRSISLKTNFKIKSNAS